MEGGNPLPNGEGIESFAGGDFLPGGGKLRRSDFDHLYLFKVQNSFV